MKLYKVDYKALSNEVFERTDKRFSASYLRRVIEITQESKLVLHLVKGIERVYSVDYMALKKELRVTETPANLRMIHLGKRQNDKLKLRIDRTLRKYKNEKSQN